MDATHHGQESSRIIWDRCLKHIKKEVSSQSYQTWFAPIIPLKYEHNTLTICVPNQFFYEWLEGHYISLLRRIVHKELGPHGGLSYQVAERNSQTFKKTNPAIVSQALVKKDQPIHINTVHLNPNFTFQHFVVGDCNQLAQAAAQAVAHNLGKTSFNPLMIHGDIGLGKTHIVQATAHHIKTQYPKKKIGYLTTEKFTAQFIQKIRENKTQDFIDMYAGMDMLIIDDIQFLGRKEKTQEVFFYIFSQLHQGDKQIIMTSDCAPNDLQGFEKRLLSRFKWGLVVKLQKPDLETRIAIIQSKLKQNCFQLSDNLIHYIATHITTNIRELEGVLISLFAHAELDKKPINQVLVKQVIGNLIESEKPRIELNVIYLQKLVASCFNISLESLKSKSRKKEIVVPRQLVMYLARKYTSDSLKKIGHILGHKDHSTVSYAVNSIRGLIGTSGSFRRQVDEIEKTIQQDIAAD